MNTIDITNSLEKDKLVNTEQSQLTDTQPHHGTSYVSHFEPHASKSQTQPKSRSVHKMPMFIMVTLKRLKASI